MKKIHRDLLDLASSQDLGQLTYRKIANMLGGEHPYNVQYNIRQLLRSGLLLENRRTGTIYLANGKLGDDKFITIPILGSVSCGVPTEIANDEDRGFVSVSPSLVDARSPKKLFALRAKGDSMNMAKINGCSVNDDDLVVVRQSEWGEANNGDYIVSVIGETANLKKLLVDRDNERLILLSESQSDYPPLIIADEDAHDYSIRGVAVGVIKALPTYF